MNLVVYVQTKSCKPEFQCPHCEACYTRKTRLNSHLEDKHGVEALRPEGRYRCPFCDHAGFRTSVDLVNHAERAHNKLGMCMLVRQNGHSPLVCGSSSGA